jgi:hypothetical protein
MTVVRETPIPCPLGGWCSNGDCRVGTEAREHLCVEEKLLLAERIAFDRWRKDNGLSLWPSDKPVPPRPWNATPEDLSRVVTPELWKDV